MDGKHRTPGGRSDPPAGSPQADAGGPIATDDHYALAERILERREDALRAGLHDAAERLLCLAWEAYDRAQSSEGRAVTYVY